MADRPGISSARRPAVDAAVFDTRGSARVRLASLGYESLLNVRGRPEDPGFPDAVAGAVGVQLPLAPNTLEIRDVRTALWLGPDEWLIVLPDGHAEQAEAAVRRARPDDPWLSVVDVSHNYSGFELSGSAARDVLSKGCPLDLHPRAFGVRRSAQSILAQARVLLSVGDDEQRVTLRVRNSFARYLVAWLVDAMAEFVD